MNEDTVKRAYFEGFNSVLTKSAQAYPGYMGFAQQQYLPVASKRDLTSEEEEDVGRMSKKWLRGPFASEGSPISRKLADPRKRAALGFLLPTLIGAGVGATGGAGGAVSGAAVGGLVGLPVAVLEYLANKKRNEDYIDRMRRLPEGATIRDMMSDPLYQRNADRAAQARALATAGSGPGLHSAALMAAIARR